MKILLVVEYFPETTNGEIRGGVESHAFYVASELSKRHSVFVLCAREKNQPRESHLNNISVFRCGFEHSFVQGGSLFSRLSFLISSIKKGRSMNIDIVDGYNFISYIAAFFITLRRKRVKRVATYNDVWVGEWIKNVGFFSGILGELLERFALFVSWDKFIAISEYTKFKLIKRKIDTNKIAVVPCGVKVEQYESILVKKFERPTVCYVGRLVEYKRVDDLLRAIKIAREIIPNIQCKIIGSGPRREELDQLAKNLRINDCVDFLGFIPKHEDVVKIIKCSHIFCLPSIVEGFGMVTVEALAAGIPYVNSDIPATREITEGGKGGLLFRVLDSNDLAEKLIRLFMDVSLYEEKAQEGKILVRQYDWGNIVPAIEKIYKQL